MSNKEGIAYSNLSADALVWRGPCLFYGAVLLVSVTGGDATIYNAQSPDAPRKVIRMEGIADQSTPFFPAKPVLLGEGLYVDVGSNVTEIVVFYEPLLEV